MVAVVGKNKRVRSWISSQNGHQIDSFDDFSKPADGNTDDDSSEAAGSDGRPAAEVDVDPVGDWEGFEDLARRSINTSKTTPRVLFLSRTLPRVVQKDGFLPQQLAGLLKLLLPTYARYIDADSRSAALVALSTLLEQDLDKGSGKLSENVVKWLDNEIKTKIVASSGNVAGSTILGLLTWSGRVFAVYYRHLGIEPLVAQRPIWETLLRAIATTYDALLGSTVKRSVKYSGTTMVRRLVRDTYQAAPHMIDSLTSNGYLKPESSAAALLGAVIDSTIRLKNKHGLQPGEGVRLVSERKATILSYLRDHIIASRILLPSHVINALSDFVSIALEESDLQPDTDLTKAMDRALLRNPEVTLTVLDAFFSAYSNPTSAKILPQVFMAKHVPANTISTRLLPALLTASKSTNALTRSSAALLCTTLVQPLISTSGKDNELLSSIVKQIAGPLQASKTFSAEHRQCLTKFLLAIAILLDQLAPGKDITHRCIGDMLTALTISTAKESNEQALQSAMELFKQCILRQLSDDHIVDPLVCNAAKTLLTPATKASLRHIVLFEICDTIWRLVDQPVHNSSSIEFSQFFAPALAAIVKQGPLPSSNIADLWAATAVLYQLSQSSHWNSVTMALPLASDLLAISPRPSFLLADRNYRRLTDSTDEIWLVRAVASVISVEGVLATCAENAEMSAAVGNALLHVAIAGTAHISRQAALDAIAKLCCKPRTHRMVLSCLQSSVNRSEGLTNKTVDDEAQGPGDQSARLRAVLQVVCRHSPDKDEVMLESLVLSHDTAFSKRDLWISLLLGSSIDPQRFCATHKARLLDKVWMAALDQSKSARLSAYAALGTLLFITPQTFLLDVVAHIELRLNHSDLVTLGESELGIMKTPIGQLYVDVLANKKAGGVTTAKGKGAALEQWDAEMRQALETKKKAATNGSVRLSKADQVLFDEQLAREAVIRANSIKAIGLGRDGLETISSLLDVCRSDAREYTARLLAALLSFVITPSANLLQPESISVVFRLYTLCDSRLEDIKRSLALTTLQATKANVIPSDLKLDDYGPLVTSVLYRLRFQSESRPFDAVTAVLSASLVCTCITEGGLGIQQNDNDSRFEQLSLAIDVISFHSRACADPLYPRQAYMAALLTALAMYPSLSRQATQSLVDIGQAIAENATQSETQLLLSAVTANELVVRTACLQALISFDLTEHETCLQIWLAAHDEDDKVSQLATQIWEDNGLDVQEATLSELVSSLDSQNAFVRSSAAPAIADTVEQLSQTVERALGLLINAYVTASQDITDQYDSFGLLTRASSDQEDPWHARVAQADALVCLAPHWRDEDVEELFHLLIRKKALGDRSESVRSKMLEAGIAAIDIKGKTNLDRLSAMFQVYLLNPTTSDAAEDRITESVIVLLGRLARHLNSQDKRGDDVVERLTQALKTPSEVVQIAVAECLPPLVRVNKDRGGRLVEQLLRQTIKAPTYAERRGAAYGLAGAVKGRGITALKEHDILDQLQEAAEDKKNVGHRQGAIFAYETLSITLGRLFEPYIVKILPLLLACLGDSSTDVREATSDAAKVIMGKISGHAVKLILPVLLETLDDKQWRTKKGAIELMGNMAYLAPRQLSQSLPTILPSLTATLTDTHAQIRAAANQSLKRFGEVIDNPEVKAMQATLLGALVDPTKKTLKALDTLLKTSFVHYIDASSLALIVPIIERALRERGTELKRKGAQIIGNMASLTESRDLIYYLPQLLPRVREVLIDPVPEARATAAKSLGILIERLGEEAFPSLVDDLMMTLKSDMSGVDQQGAAQGLAEVLSGLGVERLEAMLPEVIAFTSSARAYVREGFISLLVFLPSVFGDRFAPYLGRIIQPILGGLADESDYVREASMRAGRMIVANHSNRAVDLLLPELEESLFDERWRIRLSSIQLVGELLFRLSGISGKAEADEDAGAEDEDAYTSNNEAFKRLLEALGKDKRDKVLAAIYILRQDQAGQVRMFCITVWKTLVANTPRTVRDMLPALMQLIIKQLSAPGEEQRETAARTLGELCRKQGDRILGDIIPILQQAFKGSDITRQGCCFALAEVLDATSITQLEGHEDAIINSVRAALVDESPIVRQAAAHAFDALQTQLGGRAIDQTIPTLLVALTQGGGASEAALSALRELMSIRAHAIFPILIPTLIASPISAFNAKSLSSLVRVAGEALNKRLAQVLDALQRDAEKEPDEATKPELENAIRSVMESVSDADGLHQLMLHLLGLAKDPRHKQRVNGCKLFAVFCEVTEQDFSAYHIDWIRQLLHLARDSTLEVVEAAGFAVTAFSKTLSKEQMEDLSVALRRTIDGLCPAGEEVPGFALAGGLKPILPIFMQGLLAGTHEQREQSAFGLGDIVERTAVDALKPYVTQITGPLIRIIAERYPPPIKAAILSTLTILLIRVPQFVRPFFPQLQRTFVKNLAELASSTVRIKAAVGLGVLMSHQPRIDPLITELVNGASHDESDVRDAMASALANVVHSGGNNIGVPARDSIALLVRSTLEEPAKEAFNASIARVLGAMLLHEMTQAQPLVMGLYESRVVTIMSSVALTTCLETAPEQLYKISPTAPVAITNRILQNVINDQPAIARPAREARDMLKKLEPWESDEFVQAKLT